MGNDLLRMRSYSVGSTVEHTRPRWLSCTKSRTMSGRLALARGVNIRGDRSSHLKHATSTPQFIRTVSTNVGSRTGDSRVSESRTVGQTGGERSPLDDHRYSYWQRTGGHHTLGGKQPQTDSLSRLGPPLAGSGRRCVARGLSTTAGSGSILETFLRTSQAFNPNQGSDAILTKPLRQSTCQGNGSTLYPTREDGSTLYPGRGDAGFLSGALARTSYVNSLTKCVTTSAIDPNVVRSNQSELEVRANQRMTYSSRSCWGQTADNSNCSLGQMSDHPSRLLHRLLKGQPDACTPIYIYSSPHPAPSSHDSTPVNPSISNISGSALALTSSSENPEFIRSSLSDHTAAVGLSSHTDGGGMLSVPLDSSQHVGLDDPLGDPLDDRLDVPLDVSEVRQHVSDDCVDDSMFDYDMLQLIERGEDERGCEDVEDKTYELGHIDIDRLIMDHETELDCEMNVTDEDIGGAHGEDMGGAHGEDRDAWFLRYFKNLF